MRRAGVGWLAPFEAADDYGLGRFMERVSCVVMGRRTYEQARGFGEWPYEGKRLVLLSHAALPDLPAPATRHAGPIAPLVPALRRETGDAGWSAGRRSSRSSCGPGRWTGSRCS
jgi:dihydrofolate reductase